MRAASFFAISLIIMSSLPPLFIEAQGYKPLLDHSCTVAGVVHTDSSSPVATRVTIYQLVMQDGRQQPVASCAAQTDSNGHFACNEMVPGTYIAMAHGVAIPAFSTPATPAPAAPKAATAVYPYLFYPNAHSFGESVPFALHSGETVWREFSFSAGKPATVLGFLDARPATPTFRVALRTGGPEIQTNAPIAYDPATGRFAIDALPDGTYHVTAAWFDRGDHHATSTVTVSGASAPELHLQESLDAKVQGNILPPDQFSGLMPKTLSLREVGEAGSLYTTEIRADRSFSFRTVPAGEYLLSTEGADSTYVSTVTRSGRDIPNRHVLVSGDSAELRLNVTLSAKPASLRGSLKEADLHPSRPGIVVQSIDSGEIRVVNLAASQQFLVSGLAPGDYRLFGWSDLRAVPYRDPHYLERYAKFSTTVSAVEGQLSPDLQISVLDAAK